MRSPRVIPATAAVLVLAACGATHSVKRAGQSSHATATPESAPATSSRRTPPLQPPQALVTAETKNRLLVVDLPSGHLATQVPLPADPEDLAAVRKGGVVIVVSSSAGKVTALHRTTLRPIKTFSGFDQPHIAAISPDGQHAYITDDAQGTLTVIRLGAMIVTSTVQVGAGAHHLTFTPDQRRVWIALGESANQISILDTSDPDHPRVIGHFSPGFPAHDLSFSPNGRQIWISSAAGPDVTAFDARDRHVLFRVPVGAPPQHVAFNGRYAYLTSGYGSAIEKVDAATGRVITRTSAPYGSFELDAADGYVATSSLLRGTLAIYSPNLKRLRVVNLAPASREMAISRS
jgi:DNA-binding beta-propeller fold protein YncE